MFARQKITHIIWERHVDGDGPRFRGNSHLGAPAGTGKRRRRCDAPKAREATAVFHRRIVNLQNVEQLDETEFVSFHLNGSRAEATTALLNVIDTTNLGFCLKSVSTYYVWIGALGCFLARLVGSQSVVVQQCVRNGDETTVQIVQIDDDDALHWQRVRYKLIFN